MGKPIFISLAVLLILFGCTEHPRLTMEALKNAQYKAEGFEGVIQLKDGRYEGEPLAIPALIDALSGEYSAVRQRAASALEKIGTPEALRAVEEYEKQTGFKGDHMDSSGNEAEQKPEPSP